MKNRGRVLACAAVVFLVAAAGANAQLRLDADVNVPIYAGYSAAGVSQGAWNSYFIPFPDIQLVYQFGLGPVSLGAGVRVFSVIIENFLYPQVTAEVTLDRFVAYAGVGGFAFLEFGLISSLLQEAAGVSTLTGFHNVMLSDLGVGVKLNDWFRLNAGVYVISPFDKTIGGVFQNNVFAGYIDAKFVVVFK
jgi:hypothetical protein